MNVAYGFGTTCKLQSRDPRARSAAFGGHAQLEYNAFGNPTVTLNALNVELSFFDCFNNTDSGYCCDRYGGAGGNAFAPATV